MIFTTKNDGYNINNLYTKAKDYIDNAEDGA